MRLVVDQQLVLSCHTFVRTWKQSSANNSNISWTVFQFHRYPNFGNTSQYTIIHYDAWHSRQETILLAKRFSKSFFWKLDGNLSKQYYTRSSSWTWLFIFLKLFMCLSFLSILFLHFPEYLSLRHLVFIHEQKM